MILLNVDREWEMLFDVTEFIFTLFIIFLIIGFAAMIYKGIKNNNKDNSHGI